MRQGSSSVAVAGLLVISILMIGASARAQAPRVPPPDVAITPATAGPAVTETVPVTPAETVPVTPAETMPVATPTAPTAAPTPYAGAEAPPLTAPPGVSAPRPYATPGAAPPVRPTGFDFGGMSMAPLPAPPAGLDPSTIRRQPWRGRWWMALRMGITGPIAGQHPSAPSVLALGAGGDFGWRVGNVLGLGMGLSGQTHNLVLLEVIDGNTGQTSKRTYKGQMLYWDALFARVHLPLKRRFQPYAELGLGLARLAHAQGGKSYGPQVRAALGLEGWVSANVTLGVASTYRLNALRHVPGRDGVVVGHALQGTLELGVHW